MSPAVLNETAEEPVKLEKVEIPAGSGNYFKLNPGDKKRALAMARDQDRIDHPAATMTCPTCEGSGVVPKGEEAEAESSGPQPSKKELLARAAALNVDVNALGKRPKNADIAAAIADAEAAAADGSGE